MSPREVERSPIDIPREITNGSCIRRLRANDHKSVLTWVHQLNLSALRIPDTGDGLFQNESSIWANWQTDAWRISRSADKSEFGVSSARAIIVGRPRGRTRHRCNYYGRSSIPSRPPTVIGRSTNGAPAHLMSTRVTTTPNRTRTSLLTFNRAY